VQLGLAVALAVGLLPGLDNFAHIGGLIQGFLGGLVLLPSLAARVKPCYRLLRYVCTCICSLYEVNLEALMAVFLTLSVRHPVGGSSFS
jgi:hypothetical protein